MATLKSKCNSSNQDQKQCCHRERHFQRYNWEIEWWTLKRQFDGLWKYLAALNKRKQNTFVWIVFQPYLFSLQEPKEPQTMEKADCGKFNICQQKGLREKYSKKILFIYIETVKGNTLWEVVFPTYKILGHSFPKKAYFLGTIINSLLFLRIHLFHQGPNNTIMT